MPFFLIRHSPLRNNHFYIIIQFRFCIMLDMMGVPEWHLTWTASFLTTLKTVFIFIHFVSYLYSKDTWIIHAHNPLCQFYSNKRFICTHGDEQMYGFGNSFISWKGDIHCVMHFIKNLSWASPWECMNDTNNLNKSKQKKLIQLKASVKFLH